MVYEKDKLKKIRNAVADFVNKNWPGTDIKEIVKLISDVKLWFEFEYMKWVDDGCPDVESAEVKKVFCGECAYHDEPDNFWKCSAPENNAVNWLGPGDDNKHAWKINKHNDCKWFKQKED